MHRGKGAFARFPVGRTHSDCDVCARIGSSGVVSPRMQPTNLLWLVIFISCREEMVRGAGFEPATPTMSR